MHEHRTHPMTWHMAVTALACLGGLITASGCPEAPAVDEPEVEAEPVWQPPYEPCVEYGWSCGRIDADIEEAMRPADALAREYAEGGLGAQAAADALTERGYNAHADDRGMLAYWSQGSGLRTVNFEPSHSFSIDATDVEQLAGLMSPQEAAQMWAEDADSAELEAGAQATRRGGLSASGDRGPRERHDKRALILAPFFPYEAVQRQEVTRLSTLFDGARGYDGASVLRGPEVRRAAFDLWTRYDTIFLSTHGSNDFEATLGRRMAHFATGIFINREGSARTNFLDATVAEGSELLNVDCASLLTAFADDPRNRGLVCSSSTIPWIFKDGVKSIQTLFVAVTPEYLAYTAYGSAPLTNTLVWLSACDGTQSPRASGHDLYTTEGTTIMGFDGSVDELVARDSALDYFTRMIETFDDVSYLYEVLGDYRDSTGVKLSPMYMSGDAIRVVEVVDLVDESGGPLEASSPRLEVSKSETGEFDTLSVRADIYGVRGDHPRGPLGAHQVGVYLAGEDGEPTGDVLHPGFVGVDSERAMLIDEPTGHYAVALDDLRFPFSLSGRDFVEVVAVAKLPEGGTSELAFTVPIQDPECSWASVSIAGVGGGRDDTRSNEVTVSSPLPGLFTVNLSRVEIGPDERQTQDIHPSGLFTVEEPLTESTDPVLYTKVSGAITRGSDTVTFEYDERTGAQDATLTLQRVVGERSYKGVLTGQGETVRDGVSVGPKPFTVVFTTQSNGTTEPMPQCYDYIE